MSFDKLAKDEAYGTERPLTLRVRLPESYKVTP